MKIIICWIKEAWRTLTTQEPFSGHDFVVTELHENCQVEISECEHCGKIDISWCKGDSVMAQRIRSSNKNDTL